MSVESRSAPPVTAKLVKQDEMRLLQWITSKINATLELEEIQAMVLETMDELFGFRHSLILLFDDSDRELRVVASHGYDSPSLGTVVPLGKGPIGVAARRRKIVRVTNLGQQRAYLSRIRQQMERAGQTVGLETAPVLPGLPDAESQIAIPLQVEERLIGVFFVESPERRVFGEREESLVTIVANHAAASIRSARLFRMEAEGRAELARAHESLKRLTESLEERVRERTEELERMNLELKETQAQLLQSAKMAALGDLVAGVAHDMNTPLGSIYASADLAERAVRLVRESLSEVALESKLGKALAALEHSASTTRSGSERIMGIVRSLRQFARLDEAERKRVDLHEGIDATLELLRHRLIENVIVMREYGELPEIACYPSRLNQVFMNLVVNALEAMADGGTLTIRTARNEREVLVEVHDTGCGIPESSLHRIFDPGFTTKGVGVGMGLGLAISYRIVQDHRGRLEVESRPAQGSCFRVRLPIELT